MKNYHKISITFVVLLSSFISLAQENLSKNENGFFLMVEGSQIDWGADENDQDYMMEEIFDFDKESSLC